MTAAMVARRLFAVHPTPSGAVVALQGLSLTIEQGELLAVLGPSGAGKSTLMRCLAGALRPLAGELHGFGTRLHDAPPRALARWRTEHVGVVGQRYASSLSPDLRAVDAVMLRALLRGSDRAGARRDALALLERVGLLERAGARRGELSGGEQQRVALCAALHARPSLLLADEITGDLDDAAGAAVLELLRDLAGAHGTTVVLATHDATAAAAADRSVTVRDGRVAAELRGDVRQVVVDESGLLRLEPEDLERSGIAGRARISVEPGHVHLQAVDRADATKGAAKHPPRRRSRFRGPLVSQPTEPPRVVMRNVRGRFAVDDTDLLIDQPGLHVIVGPSGSGKTTLLHLIAGLERPTAGALEVAGADLVPMSREQLARFRREHLAVIPQAGALVAHLTARENVELALRIRGRDDRPAAEAALAAVGLGELVERRAGHLSGGEQQRVAIARAVATGAPILVADEPTASLDQRNAIAVAELLHRLAHERGAIVLCATHDHSVIARADSVIERFAGAAGRAA
jgi:peptide/nickel transport system ATP-binding protein